MKKFTQLLLAMCLIIGAIQLQAQKRYLEPIFDDVEVSGLQVGGANYTVLSWIFAASQGQQGNTIRQPLVYQTYQPAGDTETERPLVIYLHTGNFFPFPLNG